MHFCLTIVVTLVPDQIHTSDKKKKKTPSISMMKTLKMNEIEYTKIILNVSA